MTTPAPAGSARPRWRRRLLYTLFGVLLLIAALIGVTLWLAGTAGGARLTLSQVTARLPGSLEVEAIEGSLFGGVVLRGVEYRADGARVSVDRLALAVNPDALLERRIVTEVFSAGQIDVRLPVASPDAAQKPAKDAPARLDLPVDIDLTALRVEQLTLHAGGFEMQARGVDLSAALSGAMLTVRRLQLEQFALTQNKRAAVAPDPAPAGRSALVLPFDVALDALTIDQLSVVTDAVSAVARGLASHGSFADSALDLLHLDVSALDLTLPPGDGESRPLTLPDVYLPFALRVSEANVKEIAVARDGKRTALDVVTLAAAFDDGRLSLTRLRVSAPGWRVDGRGSVLARDSYPLDLALDWALAGSPWRGAASVGGSLASLSIDHRLEGTTIVTSSGRLQLLGEMEPRFDIRHDCVAGCVFGEVTTSGLAVTQRGPLSDYAFTLTSQVSHPRVPATSVSVSGRGSTAELRVDTLTAAGAAQVSGSGMLRWAAPRALRFDGRVAGFDTALLRPDMRGTLSGNVTVAGSGAEDLRASLRQVKGTLNGLPVTADGRLERIGADFLVDNFVARVGDNLLRANARGSADSLAGAVTVDAANLTQIGLGLDGVLSGRIDLAGTPQAPRVEADLRGESLAFGDWRAAALSLAGKVDDAGRIDVRAQLDGVASGTRELGALGNLALRVTGPSDALDTLVTLTGGDHDMRLSGLLAVAGGSVSGRLREGRIAIARVGEWTLEDGFDFSAGAGGTTVGAHAWRDRNATLQVHSVVIDAEHIELNAELTRMPLTPLRPFLPATFRLEGLVDARVNLQQRDALWRGTIDWQQDGTRLEIPRSEEPLVIQLPVVRIDGDLDGSNGRLKITVEGDHALRVAGDFTLRDTAGATAVAGNARIGLDELDWLAHLLPGIENLGGRFLLDLDAGGTLATPTLAGSVEWRDGRLRLPDARLELTDILLSGSGDTAGTIEVKGKATSGGGSVVLNGQLVRVFDAARSFALNISGDELKVVDWQDQEVWISPQLDLRLKEGAARVDGRIDVPRARIRVRELPPQAVRPSKDVTVIGRKSGSGLSLPVAGQIAVTVGDDVHVNALGLESDLSGALTMTLAHRKPPRFEGRLSLKNGEFSAYGQRLTVDRGHLLYNGSIDNPTLDLQASRRIAGDSASNGQVVAGVRVRGPADDPRVEIYSEPALPPTQALSYLLLGRGSFDSSGADRQVLGQAALSLGFSRSSPVSTGVAAGLGLDEFSVVGGSLDEAAVVAGKQISPDLYVRYSLGVFSDLGALLLRYRVSERLSLEAGASEAQSLDLLYSIEK